MHPQDNSQGQASNKSTAENNTPAPAAEPRTAEVDYSATPKPPELREDHHVPMHEGRRNEQHRTDEQFNSWQQQQQQQTVTAASSPPTPAPLSVSTSASNGEGNTGGTGAQGQSPQAQQRQPSMREDQHAGKGADHDRQASSV